MSKHEKLLKKINEKPTRSDITFNEVGSLLLHKGFEKFEGSGSRVKFVHKEKGLLVSLHKPHPGNELKKYAVEQLQEILKEM